MPQIAEDYVSPSVRWGLLKQDYPDAVVEFTHSLGVDIGIPENFGGKDEYCVAQILLRPTDELPIVGYKPVSDARSNKNDHPSDAWNVLCTKALGRAVKRAGYDDTCSVGRGYTKPRYLSGRSGLREQPSVPGRPSGRDRKSPASGFGHARFSHGNVGPFGR